MPRKNTNKPKLENGLCRKGVRLACVSGTGEAPGICIRVYCGSAADPMGKSGLAHLVEHLIMEAPYPGDMWFEDCYNNAVGEHFWATTWYDNIDFTLMLKKGASADDIDSMLVYLLERIFNANLEKAEFKTEKADFLKEITERPSEDATDADIIQQVYANPAWGRPPAGIYAEASSLTLKDCLSFYADFFVNSPVDIVFYGDLPFTQAKELLARFFGTYLVVNTVKPPVAKCHVYDQGCLHLAVLGHMHPLYYTSIFWCNAFSQLLNEKLDKEEGIQAVVDITLSAIDMGACGIRTFHFKGLDAQQHEVLGHHIEETMIHLDTLVTPVVFQDVEKTWLQMMNDIDTECPVADKLSWPALFIEHFNEAKLGIGESIQKNMRAVTYEDLIQYHQTQKRPLVREGVGDGSE